MSEWEKVKIGDVCKIVKGTTGIASAVPGEFPLVVTAVERKTCSTYQFDCEAVCIPLVSSSGHGKKSLNNVHYQSGKFALGTILCAAIPNNPDELDARYLHQYLQFYKDMVLVPLMKGAANVSLSMKDIAGVSIPLPPIQRQRELAEMFVTLQEKQKELFAEFEKQTEYAKQLRKNILQEAIEGKLTADWRKQHPVQKGNPDYDAEALFEKIQTEKQKKGKKQKPLPAITEAEKPFAIPSGWKWVRMGDVCEYVHRGRSPKYGMEEQLPIIAQKCNQWDKIYTNRCLFADVASIEKYTKEHYLLLGDIIINSTGGGTVGRTGLIKEYVFEKYKQFVVDSHVTIVRGDSILKKEFLYFFLTSPYIQSGLEERCSGSTNQLELATTTIREYIMPFPPLAEQKEIVARVEKHLQTITQLETQIATRETTSKQLMQSILKDAFEEG